MPRSIWNGTITFGLISVPVKVHSAIEDRGVHFHQVHARDGGRIRQRRVCAQEEVEVPYGEVAKGLEVADGEYVVLDADEIKAAAGESAHVIALEEFVCQAEIDPVFYEHTYHLGTREGGEASYRLLHDALHGCDRAGLGRWVFHNREYLVAIRALDGALGLHTMRFADELVAPDDLELPEPGRAPSPRELEMAGMLVDSLHDDFHPERFTDSYRERVLALVEAKAAGREPELPQEEAVEPAGDLLAALEASLKGSGGRAKAAKDASRARAGGSRKAGSRGGAAGSRSHSRSRR